MIYFVHGFGFDPEDPKHDPHTTLYPTWEKGVQGADLPDVFTMWFTWYSAPPTMKARLHGWWRLPLKNKWFPLAARYYYAWNLAREAGDRLARLLDDGSPATVICHSLGSRVTLCALEKTTAAKVLIFNGADEVDHARKVAKACPETTFYNVVVEEDDVLDVLGEWFTPKLGQASVIGSKGLPGLKNWIDIPLDDPTFKAKAKEFGYDLRGDNPDSIGDHSYSYNFLGNWELYRDILNDKCLMPL